MKRAGRAGDRARDVLSFPAGVPHDSESCSVPTLALVINQLAPRIDALIRLVIAVAAKTFPIQLPKHGEYAAQLPCLAQKTIGHDTRARRLTRKSLHPHNRAPSSPHRLKKANQGAQVVLSNANATLIFGRVQRLIEVQINHHIHIMRSYRSFFARDIFQLSRSIFGVWRGTWWGRGDARRLRGSKHADIKRGLDSHQSKRKLIGIWHDHARDT